MKKQLFGCAALAAIALSHAPAAQAETWKPLGQGMLRDDFMTVFYSFDQFYEFKVEIEESQETPGRYRLVNAYRNFPNLWGYPYPCDEYPQYVIIDASDPKHVYIQKGLSGNYMGYDQSMLLWSQASDYYENLYGNWTKADEEGICGKIVDRIITFPRNSLLVTPYDIPADSLRWDGADPDLGPQVGFHVANTSGKFRVKLPGAPDVDLNVATPEISADSTTVQYYVNFGQNVEYAKVALVAGNSVGGLIDKVVSGALESTRLDEAGYFSVSYSADGQYTLVAVPFYNGNAHEAVVYTHELSFGSPWISVGTAEYTEAILASNPMTKPFGVDPYTYTVDVERNKQNPNLIRIVDPYKENYPGSYDTECDFSMRHCLEFDVTDRDCVLMHHTANGIGYIIGTYGIIEMWSRAERDMKLRGKTLAEVKEAGLGGSLSNDNVITFPKDMLLVRWPMVCPPKDDGIDWYWANNNGTFKLKLDPSLIFSSVGNVAVDASDGVERLYNLQGVEIKGTPVPGIYIKVANGRSSRVIIK